VEGSVGLDLGEDFDFAEVSRSTWIGS